MGRMSFVVVLHVMALACVVIALGDRSWGWLIGGVIFFAVATAARRQLGREEETERAPARLGFVGIAILAMLGVMLFLYWLQTSA